MGTRLQLSKILHTMTPNVYFQPPESVKMKYDAIVYSRENDDSEFADNIPYKRTKRYQVTAIYKDPDSDLPDKIASLPLCTSSRFFTVDNLNHAVYNLYF